MHFRLAVAPLWFLLLLAPFRSASADDGPPSSPQSHTQQSGQKEILIISDADRAPQMAILAEVLRAHFRDLNATVSTIAPALPPRDLPAQVETVRRAVLERGAFSGIWIEESRGEIFLFVSDRAARKVFVQTFEAGGGSWEMQCETVAALVRSALITWLEVVPKTQSETEPKTAPPPRAATAKTPIPRASVPAPGPPPKATPRSEPTPKADNDSKKAEKTEEAPARSKRPPRGRIARQKRPRKERTQRPPRTEPRRPALGILDAGFAFRRLYADEPWLFNARLGARALLFETVTLGASVEMGTPSKLDIPLPDREVRLRHVPVSIDARYFHAFNRLELEAGLSLLLSLRYFDDKEGFGGTPNSTQLHLGLGTTLLVAYRILPALALFVAGGADFFFKTTRYFWDETPIFYVGAVQPFGVVGLSVRFGPRGQKPGK